MGGVQTRNILNFTDAEYLSRPFPECGKRLQSNSHAGAILELLRAAVQRIYFTICIPLLEGEERARYFVSAAASRASTRQS